MTKLRDRLSQGRILIADGATGTTLQEAGLPTGTAPERWNLENPDAIRDLHRGYVEAGADLIAPVKLGRSQTDAAKQLAIRAFSTLNCSGMARVDMFLCPDDRILVNELNTITGFTAISMYPKLWEVSGINVSDLVSRLLELALERHQQRAQLRSSLGGA